MTRDVEEIEKTSELLRQTLNEHKDDYIQILKDLVAIDTQVIGHGIDGGREQAGQEYLIKLLQSMGASSIERDPMEEKYIQSAIKEYNEGNPGHVYDDRFNVYATFEGQSDKSLMFNGHMDTMPPGELELWDTDPHDPVIKDDGRLYGLGSADMKGGLLAGVLAVKLLQDAAIDLPIDVKIVSVVDEEGGGNGSIQAAYKGQKADGVIVCEPTNRELILANMAFVFFQVEVFGKSVHSGAKWEGVNAIEKAMFLMGGISELEHDWLMRYKHPLLPSPSQNFGVIEGGTAGSSVPDYCSFKTCVHYLPNRMTYDGVVKAYTDAIKIRARGDAWLREHPPKISIYQAGGGFEIDPQEPLPQAMLQAWQTAHKTEMPIVGSPSGCDCRSWANIAGCPVIQCGPGALKDCHTPNESLEIQQFLDYIQAFAELILLWA